MKQDSIEKEFNHFISKLKLDDKQVDELFDAFRRKRIKCFWCGKKASQKGVGWFEGGKIDISFGYGSRHDMQNIDAHICDDCYDTKFLPKGHKLKKSILQLLNEELAKYSSREEKERAKKRFFTKMGVKRMQSLDHEVESGKKKLRTAKEAMGDYSKYLE